jgi:hypothetical protein
MAELEPITVIRVLEGLEAEFAVDTPVEANRSAP